jgi:hypothetical protein
MTEYFHVLDKYALRKQYPIVLHKHGVPMNLCVRRPHMQQLKALCSFRLSFLNATKCEDIVFWKMHKLRNENK